MLQGSHDAINSRLDDGRAADHRSAAAEGAHPEGDGVGVPVDDLDVVHIDPQPVGDDLGEGGFAQAWGAMEEHVVERFTALFGGGDGN